MRSDRGASDVLGSVLLVGMTVLMVAAFGVTVLNMPPPDDPLRADIWIATAAGEVHAEHQGGEAVPVDEGQILIVAGGVESAVPLAEFRAAIGDLWETGETLCLSGTAVSCIGSFDGLRLTSIHVIAGNAILAAWEGSVVTAAPDVVPVVLAVTTPAPGDPVSFTVRVYNNGTRATAGAFAVSFAIDDDATPFSTRTVADGIAAGSSVTVTSDSWTATAGAHALRVVADAGDALTETNETNNAVTYGFQTLTPDLTGYVETISPALPATGQATTFTARIHNNGSAVAVAPFRVAFHLDGSATPFSTRTVGASLAAGASTTVTSEAWAATLGVHTVRLVVDAAGELTELDETNNESSRTFATATPDLLPNVEAMTPGVAGAGAAVSFTTRVYNNGTSATTSGFTVEFFLDDAVAPFSTRTVANLIAAGGSTTVTSDPWTATAGDHTVRVVVDPANGVTELDETNNGGTRAFSVAVPVADPGFPYEDANNDLRYAAGVDVALATSVVTDGAHTATAGYGLVIPRSVGPIAVSGTMTYATSGAGILSIGVDLSSRSRLALTAGASLQMPAVRVESSNSALEITAGGAIAAAGAELVSRQALTLVAAGDIDVAGAALNAGANSITLDASSTTRTIFVQGARFLDANDRARAAPTNVAISGTPASGAIDYSG